MGAPLIAILAAVVVICITAQALLARLETPVAIWFLLLVIYHVIRRWMLIQRRRLALTAPNIVGRKCWRSARAAKKNRRTPPARRRGRHDESEIDLDAISAQSLRLVRSPDAYRPCYR